MSDKQLSLAMAILLKSGKQMTPEALNEAADLINRQATEIAALRERVREVERENAELKEHLRNVLPAATCGTLPAYDCLKNKHTCVCFINGYMRKHPELLEMLKEVHCENHR